MKIEQTRTLTRDNVELETIKYIPEKAKGIIYICHGITVPKEAPANVLKDTAIALCEEDFKVVTFDFRGHGPSGGQNEDFTMDKAQIDLDAIFKTETNDLPIGMLGFSCGATTAILYSHLNKVKLKALVLFSPALELFKASMTNKKSVIGQCLIGAKETGIYEGQGYVEMPNGFRLSKAFFDSIEKMKVDEYIPKLNTKVLICQAKRDQMLDFKLMKELGEPVSEKYVVYDTVHALVEEKDKVIKETVDWFHKYMV